MGYTIERQKDLPRYVLGTCPPGIWCINTTIIVVFDDHYDLLEHVLKGKSGRISRRGLIDVVTPFKGTITFDGVIS